jgi:predicted DCC family thiol-disulfide oxidoreductase YuxK
MCQKTEVLYNAACPICSREVDHYATLSREAGLAIDYQDLADPEALARWPLDREAAARRFHLRRGGEIYAGLPAFIALWQEIPRLRWLARLFSLPGLHGLGCWGYDRVAAPLLYRLHLRRERRGAARR